MAAWNSPANAAVRAEATPPRGPYPWYAHRPIRPQGGFEVFIGFILTTGGPAGTHPAQCAVEFWFPRGYHARPALLSFSQIDLRSGVYGRPGINARRTMRFQPTGHVYTEGRDGRLLRAPVARTHVAECLADWNGPANAAARAVAARPHAPHRLDGGREISLHGSFQAYAGLSVVIGAPGTDPPMRCYVFLHFPHGYRGGQASLSFGELNTRRGVYAHNPGIEIGVNANTGGRRPLDDRNGRLSTTGRGS